MAFSRAARIARVGVCTRPQESWALCFVVSARVPLIPTYQSASARASAAANKFSYSRPSFSFLKPSFIALSVTDEIHNRLIGFFYMGFCKNPTSYKLSFSSCIRCDNHFPNILTIQYFFSRYEIA